MDGLIAAFGAKDNKLDERYGQIKLEHITESYTLKDGIFERKITPVEIPLVDCGSDNKVDIK